MVSPQLHIVGMPIDSVRAAHIGVKGHVVYPISLKLVNFFAWIKGKVHFPIKVFVASLEGFNQFSCSHNFRFFCKVIH